MASSIVVGEIDRISGSGNGMLRADGEEYNLGPLDESAVGNRAIAVPITSTWAVCLTPYGDMETYTSRFCSATGVDESEVEEHLSSVTDHQTGSDEDILTGTGSRSEQPGLAVGDTVEVEITTNTPDRSYVIFEDGTVIEVVDTYLPSGGRTTLEIVGVTANLATARLDPTVLERAPDPGIELTVTIEESSGSTGYAVHDGVPIILPEYSGSEGDTFRVAVTEHLETGIEATISALSSDARPEVGDILTLDIDIPATDSSIVRIHDSLPIEITPTALPMEGPLPVEVLEIRANSVVARVDLARHSGLSEGAQLSLEEFTHRDDQLVTQSNGVPVIVPLSREIPSVPSSLTVSVTDIRADAIYAAIRDSPKIREISVGLGITVTTTDRTDEYLTAEYEGYPVWVSWPFQQTERPAVLTVEVSEITDCGLFASPPIYPRLELSQPGEVLPARVEAVNIDHLSASIIEPVEGESYVVPVTVPVSFDVSGEIGIEITGQKQSHPVGIVRSLTVGENATQVPLYLQKIQETILAVRARQFESAAEAAQAAANTTETSVRQAEALRWSLFAAVEAIVLADGSDKRALERITSLSETIASLDLPETYRSLIDYELEIYDDLLSVGTNRVPDSVQGLQRIAYSVDNRGRIEGIAGRIQKELIRADEAGAVEGWNPEFPHRLVVHRLAEICTQFESPPEMASRLLDEYPSIERSNWQVPPESTPEPSPSETVSVTPKTIEPLSGVDSATSTDSVDGLSDESVSEPLEDTVVEDDKSTTRIRERLLPSHEESNGDASADSQDRTQDLDEGSISGADASNDGVCMPNPDRETRDSIETDADSTTFTAEAPTTDQLRTLRSEAETAATDDPIRDTSSAGTGSRYQRAPAIKRYVQARAAGVCELCEEPAPFETPDGRPYLETHHVEELGQGGEDHPDKVAAVCPTCHKRIHYGADGDTLNKTLRERLEDGLANVGVE
jgi:hypothetical protein